MQQQHAQATHSQPHPQSSSSHQQHHLSGLHLSHTPSQVGSLGLPTTCNNNAFPSSSALTHSSSQFGQPMSREGHHSQQPSQFQIHSQSNISHAGIGQPSPSSHNSFGGAQHLQVQPILSSQQPSQASFGSLANIPSSVLAGSVVDEPAGPAHHFSNSQAGDALSGPYPWDPTHNQNALCPPSLAGNQSHQQPILPLPMVGDTRTNHGLTNATSAASFAGPNSGGQNTFGGALNASMGDLGPSLNTAIVSGLNSGGTLGTSTGPSISVSGTELSRRHNLQSDTDGAGRTGKTVKKSRTAFPKKTSMNRGRSGRTTQQPIIASITAPVTSLPTPTQPAFEKNALAVASRGIRPTRGGKLKGRERGRDLGVDDCRPEPVTSSATVAVAVPAMSRGVGGQGLSNTMIMTSTASAHTPLRSNKNGTGTACPVKANSKSRKSRRGGDGIRTTTVPVHLRNPKKGRARVFRECRQCKSENHIRRSDCLHCKAPLPAGKRRRDGNSSYDRKNAASSPIPNTNVVPQHLGTSRTASKEDVAVSSVISK